MRNYIKAYYPCTTRGRLQKYLVHKGVEYDRLNILNKYIYDITYLLERMYAEDMDDALNDRTMKFVDYIASLHSKEMSYTKDVYCTKRLITHIPDKCNVVFWKANMLPITKKEIEDFNATPK